jgi:hypothetical protein
VRGQASKASKPTGFSIQNAEAAISIFLTSTLRKLANDGKFSMLSQIPKTYDSKLKQEWMDAK